MIIGFDNYLLQTAESAQQESQAAESAQQESQTAESAQQESQAAASTASTASAGASDLAPPQATIQTLTIAVIITTAIIRRAFIIPKF